MNVLMTVGYLSADLGGPTVAVLRLAHHLGLLGCRVAVAARTSADHPHDAESGVDLIRLGRPGVPGALAAGLPGSAQRQRLRAEAARRGVQVVHDHGLWHPTHVASAGAARDGGLPWIAQPRGMLEPWSLQYRGRRKRLAWWLYQRRVLQGAAAVVATSEEERSNITRLLPGLPIDIVPNGVDWPEQVPGRGAGSRQALFLSRIHPKKQVELLVDLWCEHRPAGWKLVIAGPGEAAHVEAVRRRIAAHATAGIELRGPAYGAAKAKLLAESHLFVLPTLSENFGNAIAEAMAHGLPVLTTTATPWHDIRLQNFGWWVAPDRTAVAQALGEALASPDEALRERGLRARAWVRRFSWQAAAERLLSLYDRAASASRPA